MQGKWDNCFSYPFIVTHGVRQGEVRSTYVFVDYLDEL